MKTYSEALEAALRMLAASSDDSCCKAYDILSDLKGDLDAGTKQVITNSDHDKPLQGMFGTPESMKALTEWIERHDPESKVHLYTLQGMYYNLIASNFYLVQKGE